MGRANDSYFSNEDRDETIDKMGEATYDLLVVGGGVTGAGIALDACIRGLKTLLVDQQDFASGASKIGLICFMLKSSICTI